jgi:hypothetical protein
MIDLSTIDDATINAEYFKRKAAQEQERKRKCNDRRIADMTQFTKYIHSFNENIPILIYDRTKHMEWCVRRGDIKRSVSMWGYFKAWHLRCGNGLAWTEDEKNTYLCNSAYSFIQRIYEVDKGSFFREGIKDWVYFIYDLHEGRLLFERERESNFIKK